MAATTSSSFCAGLKLHGDRVGREISVRFRGFDCHPPPSRVELPWIQPPTMKAAMTASAPAVENTRRLPSLRLEKTKTTQEVEQGKRRGSGRRDSIVTPEKLEQWLSNSIGEIVRNMGESPFLVNIFSGEGDGDEEEGGGRGRRGGVVKCEMMSLETHKASPEDWTKIKMKWDEENRRPDAVILVEELNPSPQDDDDETAHSSLSLPALPAAAGGGGVGHSRRRHGHRRRSGAASSSSSSRKTLGLLVQGGGGGASCYILDTTRVASSFGFCTHFCLTPARLGEPLDVQLKKTWLV